MSDGPTYDLIPLLLLQHVYVGRLGLLHRLWDLPWKIQCGRICGHFHLHTQLSIIGLNQDWSCLQITWIVISSSIYQLHTLITATSVGFVLQSPVLCFTNHEWDHKWSTSLAKLLLHVFWAPLGLLHCLRYLFKEDVCVALSWALPTPHTMFSPLD